VTACFEVLSGDQPLHTGDINLQFKDRAYIHVVCIWSERQSRFRTD